VTESAEAAALSAASLITASIALLFSAWYQEIREAIDEPRPTPVDARTVWKQRRADQRRGRALPLAIALGAFLAIFTPDVVTVVTDTVERLPSPGRWDDYDVTRAALLLIWTFAGIMLWHVAGLYRRLST
jgi:hypothetical protein